MTMLTKLIIGVVVVGLIMLAVIVWSAIRSEKDLNDIHAVRKFYDILILKNEEKRLERIEKGKLR